MLPRLSARLVSAPLRSLLVASPSPSPSYSSRLPLSARVSSRLLHVSDSARYSSDNAQSSQPSAPSSSRRLRNALAALAASALALALGSASAEESKDAAAPTADAPTTTAPPSESNNTPAAAPSEEEGSKEEADEPLEFDYIIVGGGAAAYAAYAELRLNAPSARILLLTLEDALPYARPPLSQALWNETADDVAATLTYTNDEDAQQHLVLLHDGELVKYKKLLLATGSQPLVPSSLKLPEDESLAVHVDTYRNYGDFQTLDALLRDARLQRIAVVGGGLLGTELAYGLATRARQLQEKAAANNSTSRVSLLVDDAHGPLKRYLPDYLRAELTRLLERNGVHVHLNSRLTAVAPNTSGSGPALALMTETGAVESADHVVLALGSEPRVDIARESGLELAQDGGILANAELQAARDVASYWNPQRKRRERESHAEHAAMSGRLAARNMLGLESELQHASATWTRHWSGQIGPLRYDALGDLDPALETVAVWEKAKEDKEGESEVDLATLQPPLSARRGVVYYLKEKRIVGVLLWNLAHVDQAMLALKMPRDYDEANQEALRRVIPFDAQPELKAQDAAQKTDA